MSDGKPLEEIEPSVWRTVAEQSADELQLLEEESDDSAAAARDAMSDLEYDQQTAVLEALVKRALEGDAAAVTWLEERGLLVEPEYLLRRWPSCERGS